MTSDGADEARRRRRLRSLTPLMLIVLSAGVVSALAVPASAESPVPNQTATTIPATTLPPPPTTEPPPTTAPPTTAPPTTAPPTPTTQAPPTTRPRGTTRPAPPTTPAIRTIPIPDLVGETEEQARQIIAASELEIGKVDYVPSERTAAGIVLAQSPPVGIQVQPGTYTNLIVSQGAGAADAQTSEPGDNSVLAGGAAPATTVGPSAAVVEPGLSAAPAGNPRSGLGELWVNSPPWGQVIIGIAGAVLALLILKQFLGLIVDRLVPAIGQRFANGRRG